MTDEFIPLRQASVDPRAAEAFRSPSNFSSVQLGVTVYDSDARLVVCNDEYMQMYGLSKDKVRPGSAFLEVLRECSPVRNCPEAPETYAAKVLSVIRGGQCTKRVTKLSDGRIISIVNQPMPDGGWVSAHEDISAWQKLEQERDRTWTFFDTVIENIPVALFVEDVKDFRVLLANKVAADLLGVPSDQAVGLSAYDFLPKEEADYVTARHRRILESGEPVIQEEHWLHTPHGARLIRSQTRVIRDAEGNPQFLLSLAEDVTERRRNEERIAHMAHHDALTELPNRAAFAERLAYTLERATESNDPFALLSVDLDRFKEVNDVFGHAAGDELLRQLARRLTARTDGAFLARLGGDEFMLIVTEGEQPSTAAALADRLLSAAEDDFEIDGHPIRVGLSVGVVVFPGDGTDTTTLLGNVDAALYRAKVEGRGLIRFFEADMDKRLRERRTLQHELRSAVERGQLALHYQPQARANGEIIGFEALVRWHHPTRGLIPPGSFIPLAEESGLIIQMGEWILREACREAASWNKPLQIAVNLSPVQFRHGDLPGLVHAVLLETGLAASRLELEITESVLITDFSRAISILRRLKTLGVRVAMDDFGTGYSSLVYLQSFPFDKIKIDRAFISNLDGNPQSAAIVRAVIGLGRGLKLPVVAEGVETAEQLAFLLQEACDEVQGFYVGRPEPIDRYAELIGRPRAAETDTASKQTARAG